MTADRSHNTEQINLVAPSSAAQAEPATVRPDRRTTGGGIARRGSLAGRRRELRLGRPKLLPT